MSQEQAVRFGVAGAVGYRAETWKCWTRTGTGKRDVYLACRLLGGAMHLSLHESGRRHVRFIKKELFDERKAPPTPFIGVWDKAEPIVPGWTLACRIHVPWHAATIPEATLDAAVHWIECAPRGQSVEVAIFLSDHPLEEGSWPARNTMGTKPVGSLPLDGGGGVWIVHRTCATIDPNLPSLPEPNYFRGKSARHFQEVNRALLWGKQEDGSILFQESPAKVTKHPLGAGAEENREKN